MHLPNFVIPPGITLFWGLMQVKVHSLIELVAMFVFCGIYCGIFSHISYIVHASTCLHMLYPSIFVNLYPHIIITSVSQVVRSSVKRSGLAGLCEELMELMEGKQTKKMPQLCILLLVNFQNTNYALNISKGKNMILCISFNIIYI